MYMSIKKEQQVKSLKEMLASISNVKVTKYLNSKINRVKYLIP